MINALKKEGYGHLLGSVVHIGDLIFLNLLYLLFFCFLTEWGFAPKQSSQDQIILLLVINLSYSVVAYFIRINVVDNVIYFDKVVQNSSYFFIVYATIQTAALSLFGVIEASVTIWILGNLLIGCIFVLWRILLRIALKRFRAQGRNRKNVVIVGINRTGQDVFEQLVSTEVGYNVLGFFDDDESVKDQVENYLGKLEDIEKYTKEHRVDEMFCCLIGDREKLVNPLILYAEKNMIRFFLVPEYYKYIRRRMSMRFLNNIPLMTLRDEPLGYSINRFLKRSFDIVFSLIVLLTIFIPMSLICGILIKTSSKGPVFFKQKRTGIKGKEFDCYKFRSMRQNELADSKSATKGDSRVTKIGAFMRATSIDEFPQFINVLLGDMSVVGPRPHMLKQTEEYSQIIEKFMVRHLVKPGITGWAQVSGSRGEMKTVGDMEERVMKDVWYIENWTMFLDLKIIVKTVVNLFKGEENAY